MHRLFVAIRPPEFIRDLLLDAMDDSPNFRWQQTDQLHVTLRFIGEVDRRVGNDIADALWRIRAPRFDLRISGVGRFEQRNAGTLWAGLQPIAPIGALAAKIERACQQIGLEPERRSFHPHVTMARWKGHRSREVQDFLERRQELSSPPFPIEEFTLFESRLSRHGAHYEEVASFRLE